MNRHIVIEKTADRIENILSGAMENSFVEVPSIDLATLQGLAVTRGEAADGGNSASLRKPADGGDSASLNKSVQIESHKWYKIALPKGLSGDGSGYHIYLKYGSEADTGPLCLFFSGGGIAYDKHTAASPVTAGRVLAGGGGYYWDNLRPVTQLMNIGVGITDLNPHKNPFYDWNFVVITYSTGDFHIGDSDFYYTDSEGNAKVLHFHGYRNFTEAMKVATAVFPNPERLLIAGDSAGGFGAMALSPQICRDYYPDCHRVSVFVDSAFLEKEGWKSTIEDLWKAPSSVYSDIRGEGLMAEWYAHTCKEMGERVRFLFAFSPEDHLLSSFRNDIKNGDFSTDKEVQKEYRAACKRMIKELKLINPGTEVFTYGWKNIIYPGGGTQHTSVRTPYFYMPVSGKGSMASWLIGKVLTQHNVPHICRT